MLKNPVRPFILVFPIILVLAFLTRAPQVFSPLFYPDGDECVVGVMAMHIADGKDLPVYYYGQKYGFAFFEALPAALVFKIFGVSAYSLKLTMLFLWCIAVFLFYKAMKQMSGETAAWLMLIFLIAMPAWEVWSLKARGGYNTSFLFSAWILLLLARDFKIPDAKIWRYPFIGILVSVVLVAQPLWLAGMAPFFIYFLIRKKSIPAFIGMALGFGLGLLTIYALSRISPTMDYWHPHIFGVYLNHALNIPQYIYDVLQGTTTIFFKTDVGPYTDIAAYMLLYGTYGLAVVQLIRIIFKKYLLFSHLFFISILFTLFYLLFIDAQTYNPRHLLPLAQWVAGGLAIEIASLLNQNRIAKIVGIGYLLAFGICCSVSAYEFSGIDESFTHVDRGHTRMSDMDHFIHKLTEKNIHYFYAIDPMQEWQIIFMSKEQLIGVALSGHDRYPPYIEEVNKAFQEGRPFAITAPKWRMDKLPKNIIPDNLISTCDELSAIINPDNEALEKIKNVTK